MCIMEKCAAIIMAYEYSNNMTYTGILLNTLINVSPNPHQKSLFFSTWEIKQRLTTGKYADIRDLVALTPKWDSFIKPVTSSVGSEF